MGVILKTKFRVFSSLSRHSSFSEEQAQHSRRLKELQRRHNEFRRLLLGGQGPYSAGPAFLTSSATPVHLLGSEGLLSKIPVSILEICISPYSGLEYVMDYNNYKWQKKKQQKITGAGENPP